MKKFTRFLAVGGAGFVADALLFFGMTVLLQHGVVSARIVASLVALTATWLLNRRFTFGYAGIGRSLAEYLSYLAASSMGAGANLFSMWLLLDYDTSPGRMISYIVGAAAGLVVNFLLYDKWVFRSSRRLLLRS